jgi:hypothetical protein
VDTQTTQIDQQQYSGGNAMLDAQIEADLSTQTPEAEPTVTNAPKNDVGSNKAEQVDTTGPYSPDLEQKTRATCQCLKTIPVWIEILPKFSLKILVFAGIIKTALRLQ